MPPNQSDLSPHSSVLGPREVGGLFLRWWRLAVAYVVIGALGSLVVSSLTTPIYSASAALVVTQSTLVAKPTTDSDYTSLLTDERLANTYAKLLLQRSLLEKVVTDLGLPGDWHELAKRVNVGTVKDTQLVALSVEDANPERATTIANALVTQLNAEVERRRTGQYALARQKFKAFFA